jgi:hypothetical protein
MKDMKAHLERLREHAAECAMLSAQAETREKRELFAKLCADLTDAADHIQSIIDWRATLTEIAVLIFDWNDLKDSRCTGQRAADAKV